MAIAVAADHTIAYIYGFNKVSRYLDGAFLVRKKFFIFKCGYLSGSNYHNLHLKLHFSKIYRMYNFKIFCPSGLTIVTLNMTLKRVNVFHIVFHDATLKN